MIRHKNRKSDEDKKSDNVRHTLDISDVGILFHEERKKTADSHKEKSSSVERWEWQEIKYSEIDTNNRHDEKNNRDFDLSIHKAYKHRTNTNRTRE